MRGNLQKIFGTHSICREVKIRKYTEVTRRINLIIDSQRLNTEVRKNMLINPYWISGFTDGEGTFYVGINKNSTMTVGYQVLPEFRIVQHKKDIALLHAIKKYFNCGVVRVNHDDRFELRIRSIEHINQVIIPHFDKYPLITQKKFDFIKFKKIINLINQNRHLEKDGLIKIIDISSQMNRKDKKKALEIKNNILGQDKVHA